MHRAHYRHHRYTGIDDFHQTTQVREDENTNIQSLTPVSPDYRRFRLDHTSLGFSSVTSTTRSNPPLTHLSPHLIPILDL
jgi:hypothetical protein